MNRRDFLIQSGAWAALIATASGPLSTFTVAAADNSEGDRFLALSQFLTRRNKLNADLAIRIFSQLTSLTPDFSNKVVLLTHAISRSNAATVDDFLATSPAEPLFNSMKMIISAWYLGYTGTPDLSQMADNSRFVTFRDALMFEPTIDATIIPTYSRGPNGYWTQPPSTIATD